MRDLFEVDVAHRRLELHDALAAVGRRGDAGRVRFQHQRPMGPAVDGHGVRAQEADVSLVQNSLRQEDALAEFFEYDGEVVVLGIVHAAVVGRGGEALDVIDAVVAVWEEPVSPP